MWKKQNRGAREQGFKAGFVFGSRCPYPAGTDEARQWELGWAEGVLRRSSNSNSGNYRDEEIVGQSQRSGPWRQFVRRLFEN